MEDVRLGPYQLVAELGSGGMGKVYRAEVRGPVPGLEAGRPVALKVLHAHLLESPGFFKRFLREADIGRTIEHENVVRTYDCDALLHDGVQQNFLVMEYVEGQTLRDLLQELGRVPEELCRHIGREVAKGLAAIHEAGVVHRDLKPENVLITRDHVVKVMDLGVARLQDEAIRLSRAGAFVGSLEYAAPEQFRRADGEPDGRADLHALGVLLYELATGQHPYRDEDASKILRNILDVTPRRAGEVNPQLSPFFEEVVQALIAKDREERFPSASDLGLVLEKGEASRWWKERAQALRVETKRPLRRIRIPRETALYGRDDDLARLHTLYEKAKAGDGRVLLIEGEAGIGKTRLVDEFVGLLQREGEVLNFLFGSYPPGGAATAAGAFSTAYREQFGAEGLEETLEEYLTVTPVLIPAFAALLRGETTPTNAEPLTKDSLQTVFTHATRGLAAERPTIVLIDDLHFAPEDGRALFASLALAVPGHPILLIGTMRPAVPEDWIANVERLEHASRTALSRLGPKDLAKLLEDAFHSERLATELGHRIALKCDGNPFFAFEIIRGLREGQFIAQKPDGAWVSTQVIQDIQVPSSVLDLVQARIADLDEEERELLDVACCCGFQFDPGLAADVLDDRIVPTLRRLAHLESKHRLVRSSGRHFVFDHHQVQEALYSALPEQLRESYHASIAEALEVREGAADEDPRDLNGVLCVDLCEHFLKGAKGEKALRYLDAALAHLGSSYLNGQAIELADRALDVPDLLTGSDRAKVLLKKDTRLWFLGRRAAQEAVLAEARALAEVSGEKALMAQVENAAGNVLRDLSRYQEALAHHERCLAIFREVGDLPNEGKALGNLGAAYSLLHRPEEAKTHCERSLAIAREVGDRQSEGAATGNLGGVFSNLGRYDEAREHIERCLAIARETGNRRGEANALGNLGHLSCYLGRFEEARERSVQALTIAREIGDRRGEAVATVGLGNVLINLGRYEEARTHYERQLAIAREIGDRQGEAQATGNLGSVFNALGRYREAWTHHARFHAIACEIGDRSGEAIALVNLGPLLVRLGAAREGRERLLASRAICREIGERRVEGYALHDLGTAAEARGDVQTALRLYEEALALRRDIDYPSGLATTLVSMGSLLASEGRSAEAGEHLQEALSLGGRLDAPGSVVLAACHLAVLAERDATQALSALRDHEERLEHATRMKCRHLLWKATNDATHLQEAKRFLDHLVEHAPQEYRESMLTSVKLHREIMEAWAEHGEKAVGEGEAD